MTIAYRVQRQNSTLQLHQDHFGKPSARKISGDEAVRNWDPTDPDKNNPWREYLKNQSTQTNTKPTTENNQTQNNNTQNTGGNIQNKNENVNNNNTTVNTTVPDKKPDNTVKNETDKTPQDTNSQSKVEKDNKTIQQNIRRKNNAKQI